MGVTQHPLSPKPRQIVEDSLNLSKSPWYVTPTLKQASYFVGSDDRVHIASASSIQKNISKLELLQASPLSVAPSAKISTHDTAKLAGLLENFIKNYMFSVMDVKTLKLRSFLQKHKW